MASGEKLGQREAVVVGDALLAAAVAEQQSTRDSMERQRERKPRSGVAGLWLAIAALFGIQSS